MVRPAHRRAGLRVGFPERRWGVPLIDGGTQRLPQVVGLGRALDITLSGRMVQADEALAIGLLTELVDPGKHLDRALEIAEGLAAFPEGTMLADRRSIYDGLGRDVPAGLALEARSGLETLEVAQRGAARFAGGEGRGGAGAGVEPAPVSAQPRSGLATYLAFELQLAGVARPAAAYLRSDPQHSPWPCCPSASP